MSTHVKRSKKKNTLIISFIIIIIFLIVLFFTINNQQKSTTNKDKNDSKNISNNVNESESNQDNQVEENKSFDEDSQISGELSSIEPEYPTTTEYKDLYPHLYCSRPKEQLIPNKTIFLTFDDGPSERTSEVLDILKQKNVKATFFVVGNSSEQGKNLMKRIVDEGHTIGIHTYTHEFKQVYSSVKAYLDDFNKIYNLVYENTGVKPEIFRFPGGSKNGFNKNNYKDFIAEMTRRGFDYFDWNLSAGDAVSRTPTPAQTCINNILNSSQNYNTGVVLMHDAKPKHTTVEALPSIIDGLKNQGFTLEKLSHKINPSSYSLKKPYR